MSKDNFPVIEVEASGKKGWGRGAWCLVWVYAKEGNFLLKGYIQECEDYIKEKNWKCWAIFNLYHTNKSPYYSENYRTIIRTFNCNFDISKPYKMSRKKSADDWKYRVYEEGNWKNAILIKRLPKQFVDFKPPEFEGRKGSLAESSDLKRLRDKLDQNG